MGNLKNNTASLEALIEQANALPIAKTIQDSKTATPTKSVQEVRPDSGYNGLESVTIEAIPDAYQDVTGVTSTAATTLTGSKFVDKNGTLTVGTMPNNGDVSQTIDGLESQSATIPAGYTIGGTIALDSTINDTADAQATTISEIAALLEGKSVPGGSTGVETCTVTVSTSVNITIHYMAEDLSSISDIYLASGGSCVLTVPKGSLMHFMRGNETDTLLSRIDLNVDGDALRDHYTNAYQAVIAPKGNITVSCAALTDEGEK